MRLLAALLIALGFSGLSMGLGFLTWSGGGGMVLMGTIILGLGDWDWLWPLLTFFLSSSLLSLVGRGKKQETKVLGKRGPRDLSQVLANGLLPTLVVIVFAFHSWEGLLWAYLGALSAVNADTWGTELGLLARTPPRSILTGRPVPPGSSGGVTGLGTLSTLAGALVIPLSGPVLAPGLFTLSGQALLMIGASGFLGAIGDSLLGAGLQARFQCSTCGREVELRTHCGTPSERTGGLPWLSNDGVNFCSSGLGLLFALVGYLLTHP